MDSAGLGPLNASHREAVAEIVRGTGAFSDDELAIALEVFDAALGANGEDDYELVGAFSNEGALVGYAAFGPSPGTVGTYDLYWIAVDSQSQHGGIGSLLISGVERALSSRSARLLIAETSSRDDYRDTRSFYEGKGFQESARVREYYAPAEDLVVYVKQLVTQ